MLAHVTVPGFAIAMTKKMPQLLSVMTPFPFHVEATAPLREAEQLMARHNIHHLPVMVNGTIESIVSDRDIKRATLLGHRADPEEQLQIGDVCPPRAYFADVSDPLDQILDVMVDKHIGAVIVLKDGALAGIFTDKDACHTLAELLREQYPDPGDDRVA